MGAFLTALYALVARWADWAALEVEGCPDDIASHRAASRVVVGRDHPQAPAARAAGDVLDCCEQGGTDTHQPRRGVHCQQLAAISPSTTYVATPVSSPSDQANTAG